MKAKFSSRTGKKIKIKIILELAEKKKYPVEVKVLNFTFERRNSTKKLFCL